MKKTLFVLTLILVLVAGCRSAKRPPTENLSADDMAAIRATNLGLINSTPIIDIHAHTFNAKYLPRLGIVMGKRDRNRLPCLSPARA